MKSSPEAELKPNVGKVILYSFLKFLGSLAIIGALLFILNYFIDFGIFSTALEGLSRAGINIDTSNLGKFIMLSVISSFVVAGFVLLLEFQTVSKTRYEFYQDHLTAYQNFLIVQLSEKTIPYQNIVKVTFEEVPLLNVGHINIDLTALPEKSIRLRFIENAGQVASDILKLTTDYKSRMYTQRGEEYKYEDILARTA